MDDKSVDRIFMGSLVNMPPVSSKIVRIFTSSTFTDMSLERNHLMEDVYPKIKEFCREKHGLEFQVVDMRWGVRDEATDDHMTTDLCMREIQNCQRLSMGPNFVVFLGQKYGYRPIPTIIDGSEFRQIVDALTVMGYDNTLLSTWYQEDTNAIPSVFVLQPISSILPNFNNKRMPQLQAQDQSTWWTTLENLQKFLRIAAQALYETKKMDKDAMHNYMMSVTEREVINGILNVKDTKNHCLAYVRHINNINMGNLREASKFIDVINKNIDVEAQNLLNNLRDERLVEKIEKSNFMKYTVEWNGKDGLDDETHADYLKHFKCHFYKYITKLVDRAMRKEDLSSQGQIVTEILQHLYSCKNTAEVFQGREEELQYIKDYITNTCNRPLVLHGDGGSGKTSLLAKAASMVPTWCQNQKAIQIIRFLGTTPDSSSVVPMLASICQQICYNYLIPLTEVPDEHIPLIVYFKRLLSQTTKEQPLYIFLDSVDQLASANNSNKLTWLPTRLPPNVKLVVSAVSEGECKDFEILSKMIQDTKCFLRVLPLSEDVATYVIKVWLKREGRGLSSYQWSIVQSAISKCTLPIFVKLVYAEVIRWKSYTRISSNSLAYTVMDSIMKLFDRIETQHGKLLVFHALAYITASRNGLSESELEDLISLDDIVLDDVYQYHLPPVRRIPPLLWTRIRRDLPNYLTEREAGGISVMNWYHIQFRQAAIERYFKNQNTVNYFHSSIADYFLGKWGGGKPKPFTYTEMQKQRFNLKDKSGEADRKVPLQPLYFTSKDGKIRYNLRKFGELPYHLVRSQRFDDMFNEVLFNYSWLHSKLASCPLQSVLSDFEDTCNNISNTAVVREMNLVADALRLGGAVLSHYPDMLASQLLGRLLPLKNSYKLIQCLLNECDHLGPEHCALLPSYHCLHTPGGPLKYSLEGQQFAVFGFVLTSDKRYILSVSNRFIMWDLSTGEITRDINPDIPGIMQTLVLTEDDRFAASYTNYDDILILNLLSGDVYKRRIESDVENSIIGLSITNSSVIAWSEKAWLVFKLETNVLDEKYVLDDENLTLISVLYDNCSDYHLLLNKKDGETQLLRSFINGKYLKDIHFNGGLVFSEIRHFVYLVQSNIIGGYTITGYELCKNSGWCQAKVFYSTPQKVLQLDLVGRNECICVTVSLGFSIWNIEKKKEVSLSLPKNVRNISIKPLKSQSSLVLTKNKMYALGGVRKYLYLWDMESERMVKTIDAHFGRILGLKTLTVDEMDAVVSSSIDRTVKVWNIKNIFEQVHVIDRMESAIDAVYLVDVHNLAVTVTRSCIGIWALTTGKLITKLADSSIGAIVTHAAVTSSGRYIICAESGNCLVWDMEIGEVTKRIPHKNILQILLVQDSKMLILSQEKEKQILCTYLSLPSCEEEYSFTYQYTIFRKMVVTCKGEYLVFVNTEKEREYITVYSTETGVYLHKIPLRLRALKGFTELIAIPNNNDQVGLIGGSKSCIIDIKAKKLVRIYSKWNGSCTRDGKLGLHSPSKGGLELVELRKGTITKVLLPQISEGVFNVVAKFTRSDRHVIYYHSGKRTISLFRVKDGKMIANYRLSAEANAITSTRDGLSIVVGGIDGSFVVLSVVDPDIPETKTRLASLPSRTDDNKSPLSIYCKNNGKISFKFY
ncbi:NACHT and WD repeat domain-containing protein 2-like [Centruroides sculpturatus]|uniref:NACHT and WD repeat domain-containing protein 2-like n=1 Tax=Centruroides sculpturatus TaxID=218467 RepID=UPI000C6D0E05|nr:NACHT and WD repeat domain-containing protein 2-like [Centruroides sculpturatus]